LVLHPVQIRFQLDRIPYPSEESPSLRKRSVVLPSPSPSFPPP
jgi:hypothetical protein